MEEKAELEAMNRELSQMILKMNMISCKCFVVVYTVLTIHAQV